MQVNNIWGGGQGKREGGEEGEGGGRRGGWRREKRGREDGEEGAGGGRVEEEREGGGKRKFLRARAAPKGRRETRGREGGGKGPEGGEAYPPVHPLIYSTNSIKCFNYTVGRLNIKRIDFVNIEIARETACIHQQQRDNKDISHKKQFVLKLLYFNNGLHMVKDK